jgi:hypothetical protein
MAGILISNRNNGKMSCGSVVEILKVHWMNLIALSITCFFLGYNVHVSQHMMVQQENPVESRGMSHADILLQQQLNPLGIPFGKAENLPGIRNDESTSQVDPARHIYGGAGDKKHLGG